MNKKEKRENTFGVCTTKTIADKIKEDAEKSKHTLSDIINIILEKHYKPVEEFEEVK